MNNNRKHISKTVYLLLIIINIASVFMFIDSYFTLQDRNEIMAIETPIENYRILKIYCSRNSTTLILFQSKEYHLSIGSNICYDLKKGNNRLVIYFDKKRDVLFTKAGLNIKMVIAFGVIALFFGSFWLIPKKYW